MEAPQEQRALPPRLRLPAGQLGTPGGEENPGAMTHVCTCAQDGSLNRLRAIAAEHGWPYTAFPFPRDFVQQNLPTARSLIVLRTDGHPSAIRDGVLHDTFDASEGGKARIVGYWRIE